MEYIKEAIAWTMANYKGVGLVLVAVYPTLEMITRLTPTKTDDTILERVAKIVRRIMDILKIPNVKKKEGTIITPDGTHAPREVDATSEKAAQAIADKVTKETQDQ